MNESETRRFWDKVDVSGVCWEWTAAKCAGYGYFGHGPGTRRAHRIAYEHLVGPIPEGRNPDHLEPVTHGENVRRGANRRTRVTEAEAVQIRALRAAGSTLAEIRRITGRAALTVDRALGTPYTVPNHDG